MRCTKALLGYAQRCTASLCRDMVPSGVMSSLPGHDMRCTKALLGCEVLERCAMQRCTASLCCDVESSGVMSSLPWTWHEVHQSPAGIWNSCKVYRGASPSSQPDAWRWVRRVLPDGHRCHHATPGGSGMSKPLPNSSATA